MKIELNYLKHDKCPDCGARWITVGLDTFSYTNEILHHVNGGEWEYIKYACGRTDKFIPNFERVETQTPCKNTPAAKANEKRRADAKKALQTFISELNLTEGERERIDRDVRFALEH